MIIKKVWMISVRFEFAEGLKIIMMENDRKKQGFTKEIINRNITKLIFLQGV